MPVKVGLQYIDLWKESMEEVVCEKEKDDNEVTWKCDMRTITYIANK